MPFGVVATCRSPEELIMITALVFGGGFLAFALIMVGVVVELVRQAGNGGKRRKR